MGNEQYRERLSRTRRHRHLEPDHRRARIWRVVAVRRHRAPGLHHRTSRLDDAKREDLAVPRQFRGTCPGDPHRRRCDHVPSNGGPLAARLDFVAHDDMIAIDDRDPATCLRQRLAEESRHVHDRIHEPRRLRGRHDGRTARHDVEAVVHRECVVRPVVVAEHLPALRCLGAVPEVDASGLELVVVIGAEVHRPAHPVSFHDEGARIHVRVIIGRASAFDADEDRRWIRPRRAHHRDRVLAIARPRGGAWRRRLGDVDAAPEDHCRGQQPVPRQATRIATGQVRALGPEQRRIVRLCGEVEHRGMKLSATPRVGIVPSETGGSGHVGHVAARLQETRLRAEPEVIAEDPLECAEQHDVEAGAVVPVAVALGIRAVGGIVGHREDDARDGAIDQRARLLRLALVHRHRAEGDARVAHLVPVVRQAQPPVDGRIHRRCEPFGDDGVPDRDARTVGQPVVQPVVADGHAHGHLGDVEEVRRIPVAERRNREHLGLGAAHVARVARQPRGVGEQEEAAQSLARLVEEPASDLDPLDRRHVAQRVRARDDRVVNAATRRVGGDVAPDVLLLAAKQQEARVRRHRRLGTHHLGVHCGCGQGTEGEQCNSRE